MVFEASKTKFHVAKYYKYEKNLGKGAYGVVVSAVDVRSGEKVAIKKICPMAKSEYDAKHTLREIRLLRHCGKHPNIVSLRDLSVDPARDALYIMMECMDTDLHRIIQSKQELTTLHCKYFMRQIVHGLQYLHKNGIIHRDLKPANVLVAKNCSIRITDFGLARLKPDESARNLHALMTEHVVTRWYRPPELMLCPNGKYNAAVDMWSVGCILGEILGRRPLFPGKNFVHQLKLIFRVIGTPHRAKVQHIRNSQAVRFLKSLPPQRAVPWTKVYPCISSSASTVDFLTKCFEFTPEKRLTVEEAAVHAYFARAPHLTKPTPKEAEMIERPIDGRTLFDFEMRDLKPRHLRDIIIREVRDFQVRSASHPVVPPKRSPPASKSRRTRKEHGNRPVGTASTLKSQAIADKKKKKKRIVDPAVSSSASISASPSPENPAAGGEAKVSYYTSLNDKIKKLRDSINADKGPRQAPKPDAKPEPKTRRSDRPEISPAQHSPEKPANDAPSQSSSASSATQDYKENEDANPADEREEVEDTRRRKLPENSSQRREKRSEKEVMAEKWADSLFGRSVPGKTGTAGLPLNEKTHRSPSAPEPEARNPPPPAAVSRTAATCSETNAAPAAAPQARPESRRAMSRSGSRTRTTVPITPKFASDERVRMRKSRSRQRVSGSSHADNVRRMVRERSRKRIIGRSRSKPLTVPKSPNFSKPIRRRRRPSVPL